MDSQTFANHVLTLNKDEIWVAHSNDPKFAESCRMLVKDNNAYYAINHIVNSLWYKL